MACILHVLWPPVSADGIEYMDIILGIVRMSTPGVDDITRAPKKQGSPWRNNLPVLTGSLKLVIRRTQSGSSFIRKAEGFELMRLIGWRDACWNASLMPDKS